MTLWRQTSVASWSTALLLTSALVTGCADSAAPPVSIPPATPVATTDDRAAAEPTAAEVVDASDAGEADNDDTAATAPPHVERLVLLGPRGPIIVHLEISIDGQPQRAAVEQLLDKAIKSGESSEGAAPTWTALAASPAFESGQFGSRPAGSAMQQQQMVREFDVNRDGRVQRGELAACLAQNNAGGEPFSVQPLREYGVESQQDSPLFQLLDQDQDGRLSATEMADAPWRLQGRDANDDEVVTPADFRASPIPDPAMRNRRTSAPRRAFELNKLEIDSIYYALRERYDTGRGLDEASFGYSRGLFAELDTDNSGAIDQAELAGLIEARGDLQLKVTFGGAAEGRPQAVVEVQSTSDDLKATGAEIHTEPGRLIIDLAGGELDVSVVDLVPPTKPEAGKPDQPATPRPYSTLQVQVRAGDVEDALFGWLDANHDGRLTLREMQGAGQRVARLDADGDGVVSAGEIPDRMSCVIVRPPGGDMMPRGSYPVARRAAIHGPRWLAAMDTNGDGEITPREFLGTAKQFAELDLNADGYLDASEAARAASATASDAKPPASD
jgi:Ca2+-binding EF-hand superfamily protein